MASQYTHRIVINHDDTYMIAWDIVNSEIATYKSADV
mgnify:CR=1 FL=1